jgi:hypothetical protein
MALEFRPWQESAHTCPLPWPKDPDVPEGHVCGCGLRWVFQPARWEPLYTLDALRRRQEAGDFLRGIIRPSEPHHPGDLATSSMPDREPAGAEPAVIVPIRAARPAPTGMPLPPAS